MEWQPIETAPKDGTLIDIWVSGYRVPDCMWGAISKPSAGYTGPNPTWVWFDERWSEYTEFHPDQKITHWMPIPEPPKP